MGGGQRYDGRRRAIARRTSVLRASRLMRYARRRLQITLMRRLRDEGVKCAASHVLVVLREYRREGGERHVTAGERMAETRTLRQEWRTTVRDMLP